MSALIHVYPGDRAVEWFLVVLLGVALLSSAGWLSVRRLTGTPATRHLVLFSALSCCLTLPALAWVLSASGLTLFSIPILPAHHDDDEIWTRPEQAGAGLDVGKAVD